MIQQIIQQIVSELTLEVSGDAPLFIHGWRGWNNLATDEVADTVVILIEPVTSEDRIVGSMYEETYPLLMAFLEKSELEYNPDQELVYTDRMRRLRAKFIYKLQNSDSIRSVTGIVTSDEFKVNDSSLTGVGLQVRVTLLPTIDVC